jgi:hypothetical protein
MEETNKHKDQRLNSIVSSRSPRGETGQPFIELDEDEDHEYRVNNVVNGWEIQVAALEERSLVFLNWGLYNEDDIVKMLTKAQAGFLGSYGRGIW